MLLLSLLDLDKENSDEAYQCQFCFAIVFTSYFMRDGRPEKVSRLLFTNHCVFSLRVIFLFIPVFPSAYL